MKAIELFAGPGGWSEGAALARPQDETIGVEFDEEKAKKYPAKDEIIQWTQFRYTDGSLATP